jgi:hypothetical protein
MMRNLTPEQRANIERKILADRRPSGGISAPACLDFFDGINNEHL